MEQKFKMTQANLIGAKEI